jgi:DNA helicase IV
MRDVLGTIQADQDAIIRAGSRGALVVDGGPGTGLRSGSARSGAKG